MGSERALRTCMQVLVLLDLAFVQMTRAASVEWLAPLYVLTLAAPWLRRLGERRAYRLLWNLAVVGVFAVLVRHAQRADLTSVLEDGLVLAVLCQVHLLNNLRSSQRPDLLFLNAFLIAIVTGFLCRGLGFPLAFLVFAPCFLVGLQLLDATRGGRALAPDVTRRLVRDAARRAGVLVVASGLVFLFWPRDFGRKAYFRGTFELHTAARRELEVGFSDRLELDRRGEARVSDRPALEVELLEGAPHQVPELWRGATLAETRNGSWAPAGSTSFRSRRPADEPWRAEGAGLVRSGDASVRVEVLRYRQRTERLFTPLSACTLHLGSGDRHRALHPRLDGTVDVSGFAEAHYVLGLAPEGAELGGPVRERLAGWLQPLVELPENRAVGRAREIAERVVEDVPEDAAQHRVVSRLADHLSRAHTYVWPGEDGAARNLGEFLLGNGGGHCEFFASALATMLRTRGIPCRVVTGFRSSRWDEEGRTLSFRARDAHAWVEVHDPEGGWYAVDATPAAEEREGGASPWARLREGVHAGWRAVTDFDAERRTAFFAWARALPRRSVRAVAEHPVQAGLVAGLLALLLACRRRRVLPAVRTYRGALRRARLRLRPGETPRELLERARGLEIPPARLEGLEAATATHERARYGA